MRTDMECRSLGESRSNYTTDSASSLHQMKQKDTSAKTKKIKKSKGGGGFAAGLLAGAGVGVLAGILLAPERGTATRRKVTESAKKYTDQLTDLTDQATEWAKQQMNKGGKTDAHVNEAPDLPPTTATGRAFTSTGGSATTGGATTTGTTKNSPYTDTNKRSDSDVRDMINDPRNPGSTGNTGPGTTGTTGTTGGTTGTTGGPTTPTTPPRV